MFKVVELTTTISCVGNAYGFITGVVSVKFNERQLLEYVLLAADGAILISIPAATEEGAKLFFAGDNISVGKTIVGKRGYNCLYE